MKLRIYCSLAKGVLLESVRRKDLWVVAILGFLIVSAAGALGLFGMAGLESFAKDLGVSVLSAFSSILAILVSSRMMPEEIKQRTLHPLLARPITRFDLLVGKAAGAILATWIGFFILCATTALALLIFGIHFEWIMAQYVLGKMMGLALLCLVSLTISLYLTPAAAATVSFILAFGSTMLIRALVMAGTTAPKGMDWLYRTVNAFVPQYGLFDFGGRVANVGWSLVPAWVLGALALYALAYGGAAMAIGWLGFRKRPI